MLTREFQRLYHAYSTPDLPTARAVAARIVLDESGKHPMVVGFGIPSKSDGAQRRLRWGPFPFDRGILYGLMTPDAAAMIKGLHDDLSVLEVCDE